MKFKELFTEANTKYYHVTYEGNSEGYFVIKASNEKEAKKWFYDNVKELFKSSGNEISSISIATKDEEQYVINETSGGQQVMNYSSTRHKKDINVFYKVKGDVIYFKFPNTEGGMSDEIIVKFNKRIPKDQRDPELEIYNYLKKINY